jgi:hypothetical protein
MNLQPIIDNLHLIIPGIGLLVWAWAQLVASKAKAPEVNWWDNQVARSQWALSVTQQAIDWMCKAGAGKWKGAEKLTESVARVARFEDLWSKGKKLEAMAEIMGFRQDAIDKLERAGGSASPPLSPTPRPSIIPPGRPGDINRLDSPRAEDGPDSGTTLDTTPAAPADGR